METVCLEERFREVLILQTGRGLFDVSFFFGGVDVNCHFLKVVVLDFTHSFLLKAEVDSEDVLDVDIGLVLVFLKVCGVDFTSL